MLIHAHRSHARALAGPSHIVISVNAEGAVSGVEVFDAGAFDSSYAGITEARLLDRVIPQALQELRLQAQGRASGST